MMNNKIYITIAACLCSLPAIAAPSPTPRSLPPVVVEANTQSEEQVEPSNDFLKATRTWLKDDDARSLARRIMRQENAPSPSTLPAITAPAQNDSKEVQSAALPTPEAKSEIENDESQVELLLPDESPKQSAKAKSKEIESVYVEPHKVVEKSKFDGRPEPKGKPISEAIAEDRAKKQADAKKQQNIATPSAKPNSPAGFELASLPEKPTAAKTENVAADPKAKVVRIAPRQQEPQQATLPAPSQDKQKNSVVSSPDAIIKKSNSGNTRNLAMVPLSPGSYIIPPEMEVSPQQLASISPAAAPPASKIAPIGKITYSVFTSNVVDRAPQGRVAKAKVSQGALTYFSVVENLQGQYLIHRWEHDGKVLFDKPFAVNNSPSSAWSSLPLTPDLVGSITVKIMDQAGNQIGSDRVEVIP